MILSRTRLGAVMTAATMAFAVLGSVPPVALAASCTPSGPPSPNAPLPGSCFEAYDGNQVDSDGSGSGNDRTDWQNVVASVARLADNASGGKDSQFQSGSPETPDSWTFDIGSLGSGKYDITNGYVAVEPTDSSFVDLAFVRSTTSGATYMAIELNQRAPGYRTATEAHSGALLDVPTRSAGDLLITINPAGPSVHACRWGGNEHTGHWLDFAGNQVGRNDCPALSAAIAQGATNTSLITAANDFLQPGVALKAKTFAEASINLPEVLQAFGSSAICFDFRYAWLHSRSSASVTSAMQDVILPNQPTQLSNCVVSGKKWRDDIGNGIVDAADAGQAGFTIYVDYNDNSQLDAGEPSDVSASDGTYRIAGIHDGTWHIREVAQAGWTCTSPFPGGFWTITMTGSESFGADFLNQPPE